MLVFMGMRKEVSTITDVQKEHLVAEAYYKHVSRVAQTLAQS